MGTKREEEDDLGPQTVRVTVKDHESKRVVAGIVLPIASFSESKEMATTLKEAIWKLIESKTSDLVHDGKGVGNVLIGIEVE